MSKQLSLAALILCFLSFCPLWGEFVLRENMLHAQPGDFIVATQNKSYILLMIYAKEGPLLTIEEATIPENRIAGRFTSWKQWMAEGAPGSTCWIRYRLNVASGQMLDAYSFTKQGWFNLSQGDNILGKLLYLDFAYIPPNERKKAGSAPGLGRQDRRPIWQPRLVLDGQQVRGVPFNGWRGRWPKDNSDLSGKQIEIYLPAEAGAYPSYFPYWLEIQGMVGSAKVRVVDSGRGLVSPMPPLRSMTYQQIMH